MRQLQETPDLPEAAATVPRLHRDDLPRDVSLITTLRETREDITVFTHPLFTNGILYVDLAVDLKGLDLSRNAYLPLFSRAICAYSLPGMPWDEVARQLALKTGGLYTFSEASDLCGRPGETAEYLYIRLKVLEDGWAQGVDLLNRLLGETLFDDAKRIQDLLLEQRNDLKASLLPAGNSLVSLRAAASFSSVLNLEECWRGIGQYLFLDQMVKTADMKTLIDTLECLRQDLFTRNRLSLNLTGSDEIIARVKEELPEHLRAFSRRNSPLERVSRLPDPVRASASHAVLTLPTEVSFSGAAFPCSNLSKPEHAGELLVAHLLKTTWLWEEIRMKGGAYGASAAANASEGVFTLSSYRDPNIAATWEAFRKGLEKFAYHELPQDEVEQAIIGVVGRDIRPYVPGERSMIGFRRHLYNIDDQTRRAKRRTLLSADSRMVKEAAGRLLDYSQQQYTVVMTSRDKLEQEQDLLPPLADSITPLPV